MSEQRDTELAELFDELSRLRDAIIRGADQRLANYNSRYLGGQVGPSARNLACYLAMRGFDLRALQARLSAWGLSSLGRGEPHVLDNLDRILYLLQGIALTGIPQHVPQVPLQRSSAHYLDTNTQILFGNSDPRRKTRIMVTLPAEAADNPELVDSLVVNGMDCARINCAHDDRGAWARMITNVRLSAQNRGRNCKILMDLGGHKIRTGPLAAGPAVMHIKPRRNEFGEVITSALLAVDIESTTDTSSVLPRVVIPRELFAELHAAGRFAFTDTRGKTRYLDRLRPFSESRWLAECAKSAYLCADTSLHWQVPDAEGNYQTVAESPILPFSGPPCVIRLHEGDRLRLTADQCPGQPAAYDAEGRQECPARVGCTLPEIIPRLRPGHRVWLDDGKIGALVETIGIDHVILEITQSGPHGSRLKAEKGLNFPDTDLDLPPLNAKDLVDLDFVCCNADMVGFSFVTSLADMDCLISELARRDAAHMPIIAKIETSSAVQHLPEILLGCIDHHPIGVMIARGDLSVELGSVRLAEIQEELLWLCEAAHVPVIWATQVLETLVTKGLRSRPEFTDAAMSVRAECVMLNKGPYIVQALRALNNLLLRMQDHQYKKNPLLRALQLASAQNDEKSGSEKPFSKDSA